MNSERVDCWDSRGNMGLGLDNQSIGLFIIGSLSGRVESSRGELEGVLELVHLGELIAQLVQLPEYSN